MLCCARMHQPVAISRRVLLDKYEYVRVHLPFLTPSTLVILHHPAAQLIVNPLFCSVLDHLDHYSNAQNPA
jgi:hypothetical protein